jgi:hypothetical protein
MTSNLINSPRLGRELATAPGPAEAAAAAPGLVAVRLGTGRGGEPEPVGRGSTRVAGTSIDVPLAHKDALNVRDFYDTSEVRPGGQL